MSHDQNFKNLILDYPHQALAFFAAEEAPDKLADAEVVPVRQEQLEERLGERFRELDVPLLVRWPDGRREALLFVIEEESDPRRFSIHRLAHYCLDLGELLETDRVVPVAIFLRGRASRRELVFGGDRHEYLHFRFLACELATIAYEGYRDSDNIVARITLPNMLSAPEHKLDAYAAAVRGLVSLEDDPEKQLKYFDFIDMYANLNDNERDQYAREYPREAEMISRFAQQYIQQGLEQGMQQGLEQGMQQGKEDGRKEGRQEGEAIVLLRLLHLKFGEVPETARRRIESADPQTLLAWSERVLTARSLEQIFGE